jgi:hypothetical protein
MLTVLNYCFTLHDEDTMSIFEVLRMVSAQRSLIIKLLHHMSRGSGAAESSSAPWPQSVSRRHSALGERADRRITEQVVNKRPRTWGTQTPPAGASSSALARKPSRQAMLRGGEKRLRALTLLTISSAQLVRLANASRCGDARQRGR